MPTTIFRQFPLGSRQLLDGGYVSKFDKVLIADNESPDCKNVRFGDATVFTRGGTNQTTAVSVGSFACDGLYTRHNNSGSQTMVAWFNGTLYDFRGTNSLVTVPSAQSIFTAGLRVAAAEYENYMFFGNGGNPGYKYNESFTRQGIPAPTATSTVASQATGTLTGGYRYAVSYLNSNLAEGNVGPFTATFTAASATLRVSALPVAPASFGVSSRRLYRTVAGGAIFKLLTTISDNTTTTYDDNAVDGALGVTGPTDNNVPPNYSIIITHQNRVFVDDPSNLNLVKYSDIANPYIFPSANFIRIGDHTSDLVRAFGIFDNSLFIFCDRTTWLVYMQSTDPSTWISIQVRSPYGSKSPFATFFYQNKVGFAAMQGDKFVGIGAISGDTLDPSTTLLTISAAGSDLKSNQIEPDMFQVQGSYIRNISSMVYKNRCYISVTYGTGNLTNNRIYVFDFSISDLTRGVPYAWSPDTGINPAQFTIYNENLYFGPSTATGHLYQYETSTYNDVGGAIDSYFATKEFAGIPGEENLFKDFRYSNIFFEKSGAYYMKFNYKTDSDLGVGENILIDLTPGGSLWGTMMWGSDNWGGGQANGEIREYLGTARGKRIQFTFSNRNTLNQKFKVLGLNFYYFLKGLR